MLENEEVNSQFRIDFEDNSTIVPISKKNGIKVGQIQGTNVGLVRKLNTILDNGLITKDGISMAEGHIQQTVTIEQLGISENTYINQKNRYTPENILSSLRAIWYTQFTEDEYDEQYGPQDKVTRHLDKTRKIRALIDVNESAIDDKTLVFTYNPDFLRIHMLRPDRSARVLLANYLNESIDNPNVWHFIHNILDLRLLVDENNKYYTFPAEKDIELMDFFIGLGHSEQKSIEIISDNRIRTQILDGVRDWLITRGQENLSGMMDLGFDWETYRNPNSVTAKKIPQKKRIHTTVKISYIINRTVDFKEFKEVEDEEVNKLLRELYKFPIDKLDDIVAEMNEFDEFLQIGEREKESNEEKGEINSDSHLKPMGEIEIPTFLSSEKRDDINYSEKNVEKVIEDWDNNYDEESLKDSEFDIIKYLFELEELNRGLILHFEGFLKSGDPFHLKKMMGTSEIKVSIKDLNRYLEYNISEAYITYINYVKAREPIFKDKNSLAGILAGYINKDKKGYTPEKEYNLPSLESWKKAISHHLDKKPIIIPKGQKNFKVKNILTKAKNKLQASSSSLLAPSIGAFLGMTINKEDTKLIDENSEYVRNYLIKHIDANIERYGEQDHEWWTKKYEYEGKMITAAHFIRFDMYDKMIELIKEKKSK